VTVHIRSNPLVVTVALLTSVLLGGCGSSSDAIDTSNIDTITDKTLTVCSDIPYAPFELGENGNYSGIDIDILDAIGKDLGYSVTFKPTAFDDIFDVMNNKGCDMVASAVSISQERRNTMLFSNGYFEINQSLLIRAEDVATFASLEGLKGRKIGVQTGTTGEQYAKTHSDPAMVVSIDGADDLEAALKSKAVDGVIMDFPVNSYMAQQDISLQVVQTFTDVDREEYGIALPLQADELQIAVNKSLEKIREDGRYDAILSKYLGSATAQ
jgi:polar amino acid transport system substrate-binding protein